MLEEIKVKAQERDTETDTAKAISLIGAVFALTALYLMVFTQPWSYGWFVFGVVWITGGVIVYAWLVYTIQEVILG